MLVNSGGELDADRVTALLLEAVEYGISNIHFSGGEPFLYYELEKVILAAYDAGLGVCVISNGKCFEKDNLALLLRLQPDLQITFDGHNAETHDLTRGLGNFEQIISGILNAKKSGYHGAVTARINLHRGNIGQVSKILNMLEGKFDVDGEDNRDIENISVAAIRRTEDSGIEFTEYLKADEYLSYPEMIEMFDNWNGRHRAQIKHDFSVPDMGCAFNAENGSIQCGLRIALNGNVFPCQMFTIDKFAIGNIYDNTLVDIMNGTALENFSDMMRERLGKIPQCSGCGFKFICAGGCPAEAYIENGTLFSVSSKCTARKRYMADAFVMAAKNHSRSTMSHS
jgi:radical SAM protein with 4Fe4S-binding SPASM domain